MFRPIADHHIVRLIHKFNPENQNPVQTGKRILWKKGKPSRLVVRKMRNADLSPFRNFHFYSGTYEKSLNDPHFVKKI
jgi:hypothetical protein